MKTWIVAALIAAGGHASAQKLDLRESMEDSLVTTVRKEAQAEFQAYKSVPLLDTAELAEYSVVGDSCYMEVYGRLRRAIDSSWVLDNLGNPSTFSQKSVRVASVSGDETDATVTTREYWLISWFIVDKQRYRQHVYDETNKQWYHLVRIGGVWKVKNVVYPARKK